MLGFGLGLLIVGQVGGRVRRAWLIIVGLTLAGFLIGGFGGERGINWIGRMIRDREQS